MSRQLTLTAAEWASVQPDGTLWLAWEGRATDWHPDDPRHGRSVPFLPLPPAEFVQACAPCPRCGDKRGWVSRGPMEWVDCGICAIELVGPCTICGRPRSTDWPLCANPTLGYAYAIGQPLPIRKWPPLVDGPQGKWIAVLNGHRPVMQVSDGNHRHTSPMDRDALAHYGPPETLVDRWALQLRVVQ